MGITRDIVNKATKDEAFRQRLLVDAKAAIKQEFGVDLPAGVKVAIHENAANVINLVLPPSADSRELSADDLELVAGGMKKNVVKGGFVTMPCTNTMC